MTRKAFFGKMAWFKLNDSLNTLKGQISNVVQEVFTEDIVEDENSRDPNASPAIRIKDAENQIEQLTELCTSQDAEVRFNLTKT